MTYDIAACAQAVREDGFCILRNLFPRDALEACRIAFAPILSAYIANLKDPPNRGPNRHYISLPLAPPFYHPRFFDDDTLHAILEALLGQNYAMVQYATDTPLKGSVYQDVHGDLPPLFFEEPDHLYPAPVIGVNFPFIDVTPAHGPFEAARGTHRLPRSEALRLAAGGDLVFEPLLMNAGDVMIRDPRCLHRGSPNTTDTPRPVAVIGVQRSWMWRGEELLDASPITQAVWDILSEREQRCLRHWKNRTRQGLAGIIPVSTSVDVLKMTDAPAK